MRTIKSSLASCPVLAGAIALISIGAATAPARASLHYFTFEHVDIEALFENDQLQIGYHDDDNDLEFSADEAAPYLTDPLSRDGTSAGAAFAFLGVAPGEELWVIPSSLPTYLFGGDPVDGRDPLVPFMGFAKGELGAEFSQVRFGFDTTGFSGPGRFSLFNDSGTLFMSSDLTNNPFNNAVVPNLTPTIASHTHFNFAFSEAGTYILPIRVQAVRGGVTLFSEWTDLTFQVGPLGVIPEPSSVALVAIGGMGLVGAAVRRRVRRGVNA